MVDRTGGGREHITNKVLTYRWLTEQDEGGEGEGRGGEREHIGSKVLHTCRKRS